MTTTTAVQSSTWISLWKSGQASTFWSNYVLGMVQAFHKSGHTLKGMNMAISGNVPQGTGLSSSASLEMVTGLTLAHPERFRDQQSELALAGQSF